MKTPCFAPAPCWWIRARGTGKDLFLPADSMSPGAGIAALASVQRPPRGRSATTHCWLLSSHRCRGSDQVGEASRHRLGMLPHDLVLILECFHSAAGTLHGNRVILID